VLTLTVLALTALARCDPSMESSDGEDAAVATMAGEVLNSPDGSAALAASRFVQADQLLAVGSATQRAPVGGVTGRGPVKPPQSWLAELREEAAKAGAPPLLEMQREA
jgi:hypothetical protein